MKRLLIPLFGLVTILILTSCSTVTTPDATPAPAPTPAPTEKPVDTPQATPTAEPATEPDLPLAPDFELTALSGETVKLSDYLGKTVFINFFATWCGPCMGEMPELAELVKDYESNEDVVLLLINLKEKESDIRNKFEKENLIFNDAIVLLDSSGTVSDMYGARSIPTSLVINAEGQVVYGIVGAPQEPYSYYDTMIRDAQ